MLVVMWVGAGIYYFRGRPESRSADSIGSFRHQLRVLERTAPPAIDPAHRLRERVPLGLSSSVPSAGPLTMPLAVSSGSTRRRRTLKRRRDIFFGLCLGLVGSLLLGLVPGLRVMWILAAVLAVALGAYTVVLIQLRNQAAERAMKVRFLPNSGTGEPALLLRRPAN